MYNHATLTSQMGSYSKYNNIATFINYSSLVLWKYDPNLFFWRVQIQERKLGNIEMHFCYVIASLNHQYHLFCSRG